MSETVESTILCNQETGTFSACLCPEHQKALPENASKIISFSTQDFLFNLSSTVREKLLEKSGQVLSLQIEAELNPLTVEKIDLDWFKDALSIVGEEGIGRGLECLTISLDYYDEENLDIEKFTVLDDDESGHPHSSVWNALISTVSPTLRHLSIKSLGDRFPYVIPAFVIRKLLAEAPRLEFIGGLFPKSTLIEDMSALLAISDYEEIYKINLEIKDEEMERNLARKLPNFLNLMELELKLDKALDQRQFKLDLSPFFRLNRVRIVVAEDGEESALVPVVEFVPPAGGNGGIRDLSLDGVLLKQGIWTNIDSVAPSLAEIYCELSDLPELDSAASLLPLATLRSLQFVQITGASWEKLELMKFVCEAPLTVVLTVTRIDVKEGDEQFQDIVTGILDLLTEEDWLRKRAGKSLQLVLHFNVQNDMAWVSEHEGKYFENLNVWTGGIRGKVAAKDCLINIDILTSKNDPSTATCGR